MRKFLAEILNKIGTIFNYLSRKAYLPIQKKRVMAWFKIDGDKTLRLNYDLNENSIVFDVGGYKGQWSSDIYSMYDCRIFIFEPVKEFAENIKRRFQKNKKIKVFPFGLSSRTIKTKMLLSKDGSSAMLNGQDNELVDLIKASDFIQNNNIENIDLIKINIEGGEYDLLENLIEAKLIKRIKKIQIQFHDFVPNAEVRMKKIQKQLEKTHHLTYQYEFVWENWELN